jgi:hypothetical protein
MSERVPPKAMTKKLVRVLRPQHPDAVYLKKVFQHTRDLLGAMPERPAKHLPELLTDTELDAFYQAVRPYTNICDTRGKVAFRCKNSHENPYISGGF